MLLGFIAVLGVIACGRSEAPATTDETAVQLAPVAAADLAAAPIVSAASGLEIGIIYAGNMMGKLEPCG